MLILRYTRPDSIKVLVLFTTFHLAYYLQIYISFLILMKKYDLSYLKKNYLKSTRCGKYPCSPWSVDRITAILEASSLKIGVTWFWTQLLFVWWNETSAATWNLSNSEDYFWTCFIYYPTHRFAVVERRGAEGVVNGCLGQWQPCYT